MANLNLILLGVGVVALLISLIVLVLQLTKGTNKINGGLVGLLVLGVAFLIAGIVINPSDSVDEVTASEEIAEGNDQTGTEEQIQNSTNDSTKNETGVAVLINDNLTIYESDPLEIARLLVEQEMADQEGLKSWEITDHQITSDSNVFNIRDYDKPVGDMRIVWVEGYVRATAEDDGSTGSIGYNLELYQMAEQDPNWYVGNHWGVLRDLEVTKTPDYVEDDRYFSDSDELIFDEENGGLASINTPEYGESFEEANPDKVTTADDLIGAWHWREYDDIYMILRNDGSYSYVEKNAEFFAEGTYKVNQMDDHYEVTIKYSTGEQDGVMTIKLRDKNHLKATEDGYAWDAKRVDLAVVEGILSGIKGR